MEVSNLTNNLGIEITSLSSEDVDSSCLIVKRKTTKTLVIEEEYGGPILQGIPLNEVSGLTEYGKRIAVKIPEILGVNNFSFNDSNTVALEIVYPATDHVEKIEKSLDDLLDERMGDFQLDIRELNQLPIKIHRDIIMEDDEESFRLYYINKMINHHNERNKPIYVDQNAAYSKFSPFNSTVINALLAIGGITQIDTRLRDISVVFEPDIKPEDIEERILKILIQNLV